MNFGSVMTVLMPYLASAGFVTLNEMGDKTQLLAMAFATRMKFWKVMTGVLIATVLNHGLAVAAGSMLARVPGWSAWVQFVAAIMFVFFGLWALVSDTLDGGEKKKSKYGDVATVAIAFFLAEMGDKTQLATIALSSKYAAFPVAVLLGTTTGMLIADGVGILAGVVLNKKIPAGILKLFAAGAFVVFGLIGIWQSLTGTFQFTIAGASLVVAAAALFSLLVGSVLYKKDKKKNASN